MGRYANLYVPLLRIFISGAGKQTIVTVRRVLCCVCYEISCSLYSVSVCCYYSYRTVDAISLPGPAFWLELKKLSAVRCMDHIAKKGGKHKLKKNPLSLI